MEAGRSPDRAGVDAVVRSAARLAAVKRARLLDTAPDEAFDRATRIASTHLGAPVSLLSVVDETRQFFKSQVGLEEPWSSERETPLSHSFCQIVVGTDDVLRVTNAREDPRVSDNLAIRDLGVIAYLGVPVRDTDGQVLGSLCAIDHVPREWSPRDAQLLRDLAAMLETELHLRATLDEAVEHEAARNEMLAVLSHDLRTPLTVLVGASRTLVDKKDQLREAERDELLEVVARQAMRSADLVDRLLTLEGRLPDPKFEEVDLRRLVANLVSDLDNDHVALTQGPDVRLTTDASMVEQILGNLVDNAIAHAGDGASVILSVIPRDERVELRVDDNGVGIPSDRIEHVFDRSVTTGGDGHHGLGLHIVRKLTEALGGEVTVSSPPGHGATFKVFLPA